MAGSYSLTIQNATNKGLYFAVYQRCRFNNELKSVAWKVISLPPKVDGSPIPASDLHWTHNYGVCTAQFDNKQRKYIANQVLPAELGRCYKVVSLNHTASISEEYDNEENSQHIVFENKTSDPVTQLNMGFVMDNDIVAIEKDVGGQERISHPINNTYYVACYHHIETSQLVDEGLIIGPIKIRYEPGISRQIVQAYKNASDEYLLRQHRAELDTFHDEIDYANTYRLMLQNCTDRPWYLGIYQKGISGCTSVAWKVCGLPPMVSDVPTADEVKWTMEYGICIARFNDDERYIAIQYAPAKVHNSYNIISIDGIPSISTIPTQLKKTENITVKNKTGPPSQLLTVGFTLDQSIIAVHDRVGGEQEVVLQPQHSYYVACFHNLISGQPVSEGIAVGPVEVKYCSSVHTASVNVFKDLAGNYLMKATYK